MLCFSNALLWVNAYGFIVKSAWVLFTNPASCRELAEEKGTNLDAMDQVDAAFACDPSGLVNATPLGMIGNPGMAVTPAQLALLGPTAWVFDCVYVAHPKGCKSVLVRAAEER